MVSWHDFIVEKVNQLPLQRKRITKIAGNPRYLLTNAKQLLNFISNDYLALSNDPNLINALYESSKVYGVGSSGAPSLSGYSKEHELLAREIANWLNFDKCLLFNGGYQLNISLYSQLMNQSTYIWLDKNCHASHIDGVLLSKAKFSRFSDTTIKKMREKIKAQPDRLHIIISEGCFSMDGTCHYLDKLIKIKQETPLNVLLIIDDAHGIGSLGDKGTGTLENLGIELNNVDLIIGTFGKAFATHGGFICGNSAIIDYLEQSVRSQIYSTNLPPAIAAATRSALSIIKSSQGFKLREALTTNILYFKKLARESDIQLYNHGTNFSPIQLIMLNSYEKLRQVHKFLFEEQILVGKILFPTVPKAMPRLRISLNAAHQIADVKRLITSLNKVYNDE